MNSPIPVSVLSESQLPCSPALPKKGLGLRGKATFLAMAIATLPVLVVGALSYGFSSRILDTQQKNTQRLEAKLLADKVSLFMTTHYANIKTLAQQPILTNSTLKKQADTEQLERFLNSYLKAYGVYDSITFMDMQGNDLAATGGAAHTNHIDDDYFQAAIKSDIPFISNPRFSKSAGGVVVFIASIVKDDQTGKPLGVVRTRIPVASLAGLFASAEELGAYHLADQSGIFFVAQEEEELGEEANETFTTLAAETANLDSAAFTEYEIGEGEWKLLGYAITPPVFELDLGWFVILETDEEIAFASLRRLAITFGIGTLLTALMASLVAASIVNRVIKPLQAAAVSLQAIGQGNFSTRLPVEGTDEVAQLANNINLMAGQIEDLLGSLRGSQVQIEQQKESAIEESQLLQEDVGQLLAVVSEVEEGNLAVEAQVSDRATGLVADTLNRLIDQLAKVLVQVLHTAQQVNDRSRNLESMSRTVAQNAGQQANAVAESLLLSERVAESALDSSETLQQTNLALLETYTSIQTGQTAIARLNQGIEVLQQGTDRIVQRMKALGEFVGLADQFVQDQGQIASMTQVLSLNATLVAARASEQRDPRQFQLVAREFSSIAEQVSELAQQTNTALEVLEQRTHQIHSVVAGIDSDVQGLGSLVSDLTKGVDQSSRLFDQVAVTTAAAVQSGEQVAQSNQDIVGAAQSTAGLTRNIALLAEQSADLTQTTQHQSEQMAQLAEQLLQSIQFFRLPQSPSALITGNLPIIDDSPISVGRIDPELLSSGSLTDFEFANLETPPRDPSSAVV